ncbi:unnamed protein product, partial [Hapterophycus canaliculatus]
SLSGAPVSHSAMAKGTRFFWRSKENIDLAFHFNKDEGLITISTRCPERSYNYPAIFVDASKIPVHKSEAVAKANSVGQFDAMSEEERQEATEAAMMALRIEYLQHRLKVPDEVNGPRAQGSGDAWGAKTPSESEETSSSSSREEQDAKKSGRGEVAVVLPDSGFGTTMVPWTQKPGEMTPQDRAADKAKHRPFLVRLSTDKWNSLLCARNIVLQTPHRFGAGRRSSMADFRRASLEFEQLAKETEKLSTVAEKKTRKVEASIDNIVEC